MKLRDNLYKIISKDEDAAVFKIELIPDCVIYKAHFPGMPITPGVCIVQIAGELVEEYLGEKLLLTDVANAKFLSVLNPEKTGIVDCSIRKLQKEEDSDEFMKAAVEVYDNSGVYAKLSLRMKIIRGI